MWADFDVIGGFDEERTPQFNAEDTVNWYMIIDETAKKPKALMGCPGIKSEATVIPDVGFENRAYYTVGATMYIVVGDSVYRTSDGTNYTHMGNITTDAGFLRMVSNNAGQILIVDGVSGHIINTNTNTLTQITDPDFPSLPIDAAYLDSYFIVLKGGSTQFNISAPNDGLNWDEFDYAQINAYSGNLIGVAVVNRRIFFMKTTSTEVWYNGGFSDFPFRRDNNLIFNYGALNAWSIQSEHGFLFWLSSDKSGVSSIVMSNGLEPITISSQSLDNKIRNFVAPQDCSAYIYKDNGHVFYNISWTTDDKTFFYDATVGKSFGDKAWYRLEMQPHKATEDNPNADKTRHVSQCHAFFNNEHYIGSYKEPRIYTMSLNYTDNDGEPIRRERIFRHFSSGGYLKRQIKGLRVDFKNGIGAPSGVYRVPQAYLSISKNGGLSFQNEKPAPLGALGQFNARCIWRRLGVHEDFVGKVSIYADVGPTFMLGGAIDYVELRR